MKHILVREDEPTELDFYWGNVTAKIGYIR
jgi:hypothetical protein